MTIINNSNTDKNQDTIPTNIVADESAVKSGDSHEAITDNKTNVPIDSGGYGNVADWNDATAENDSSK